MLDTFLLGVIGTASMGIAVFFLKYWKKSGDRLFLAFSVAFIVEGLSRVYLLTLDNPAEGRPFVYILRLIAALVVLIAIVGRNFGRKSA